MSVAVTFTFTPAGIIKFSSTIVPPTVLVPFLPTSLPSECVHVVLSPVKSPLFA